MKEIVRVQFGYGSHLSPFLNPRVIRVWLEAAEVGIYLHQCQMSRVFISALGGEREAMTYLRIRHVSFFFPSFYLISFRMLDYLVL